MPQVCVLLAEGFEEMEAVTVVDVLRRAGLEASLVTVAGPEVTGAYGVTVRSDMSLATARHRTWSAIVVPGGEGGAAVLRDSPAVRKLLAASGVAAGKTLTTYPGHEAALAQGGAQVVTDSLVEDGAVVTGRGPAVASPFALALVRRLAGERVAREVARALLIDP
jgi:4-methyl-5(b-hydroxyethyl)-thiazole monophosphate biosynthesis